MTKKQIYMIYFFVYYLENTFQSVTYLYANRAQWHGAVCLQVTLENRLFVTLYQDHLLLDKPLYGPIFFLFVVLHLP